ncbi:MAG: hypothetical protein ABR584_05995 [Candidatus Baltobacteraceae bacterium]
MKVRPVRLLGLALVAGTIFFALTPSLDASRPRTLAVVRLHTSALHSTTAMPIAAPHGAPDVLPGPTTSVRTPVRPSAKPVRLLRPILPWWLRRRHLAAPPSLAA